MPAVVIIDIEEYNSDREIQLFMLLTVNYYRASMYPVVMEKSIPSYSDNTKFLPNLRTIEQNRMLSIKATINSKTYE